MSEVCKSGNGVVAETTMETSNARGQLNDSSDAASPASAADVSAAGDASNASSKTLEINSPPNVDMKKTPAKRTPSKRMSYIERARKESEELVRNMGGSLELDGGRRTRSSSRGTPTRSAVAATITPPPAKKARSSPAVKQNSAATVTPPNTTATTSRARGRGRKIDVSNDEAMVKSTTDKDSNETTTTDETKISKDEHNSKENCDELTKEPQLKAINAMETEDTTVDGATKAPEPEVDEVNAAKKDKGSDDNENETSEQKTASESKSDTDHVVDDNMNKQTKPEDVKKVEEKNSEDVPMETDAATAEQEEAKMETSEYTPEEEEEIKSATNISDNAQMNAKEETQATITNETDNAVVNPPSDASTTGENVKSTKTTCNKEEQHDEKESTIDSAAVDNKELSTSEPMDIDSKSKSNDDNATIAADESKLNVIAPTNNTTITTAIASSNALDKVNSIEDNSNATNTTSDLPVNSYTKEQISQVEKSDAAQDVIADNQPAADVVSSKSAENNQSNAEGDKPANTPQPSVEISPSTESNNDVDAPVVFESVPQITINAVSMNPDKEEASNNQDKTTVTTTPLNKSENDFCEPKIVSPTTTISTDNEAATTTAP